MRGPIYFSGSISAGRSDVDIYQRIIARLQQAGFELFSGSVGDNALATRDETLREDEIYRRDIGWLKEVARRSGILVAEVSRPSLGVGVEITTAKTLGIPVICLWSPRHVSRCSAMIAGDPAITLIRYAENSVESAVEQLLQNLIDLANKSGGSGVERFA